MRPRLALVSLSLALASACSCTESETARAVELRALVEPHRTEFAEYDRWARRVGLGDAAFRSEEALAEAAFAPLRGRQSVLAAWIERRGPDGHLIAQPAAAAAPPAEGWVRTRLRELGELEAQVAAIRIEGDETRCLLVRRSAPAPGGATLVVTMAFAATH